MGTGEEEPQFHDLIRLQDGSADWRLSYERISGYYNRALFYFRRRAKMDTALIEYLIRLRIKARRNREFKLADEIRAALNDANVLIEDHPDHIEWWVDCSSFGGKVPIDDEHQSTNQPAGSTTTL